MKEIYWIVGIIIIISVIIVSTFIYLNCSFVSARDMGLYGQCKIWKESGYIDENFRIPMFLKPNIREEYIPPIPKEEIINQAKEVCENILTRYNICKTTGLWKSQQEPEETETIEPIYETLREGNCTRDLDFIPTTSYLNENQLITFVGKYEPQNNNLTELYKLRPCLEWMTDKQCRIIYRKKQNVTEDLIYYNFKTFGCPENVKNTFYNLDAGTYNTTKDCCVYNGSCEWVKTELPKELLGSRYPTANEICFVQIHDPHTEKGCRLFKLDKPLENIEEGSYVRVSGYLSPPDFSLSINEVPYFILNVSDFIQLPVTIDSIQAKEICEESLNEKMDGLMTYCSDNNFSCNLTFYSWRSRLKNNEKWLVGKQFGHKWITAPTHSRSIHVFCVIDPYTSSHDFIICTKDYIGGP